MILCKILDLNYRFYISYYVKYRFYINVNRCEGKVRKGYPHNKNVKQI